MRLIPTIGYYLSRWIRQVLKTSTQSDKIDFLSSNGALLSRPRLSLYNRDNISRQDLITGRIMSRLELAYVALAVRDLNPVEAFLANDLSLAQYAVHGPDGPLLAFGVGRTVLVLFEAGDPMLSNERAGVDHIAFAADDPKATVQALGLTKHAREGIGLRDQIQFTIDRTKTAGLSTRFTKPLGLGGEPSTHVERIDHLGVASANNQVAKNVFGSQIGLPIESEQTDMEINITVESFTSDKYGVVYRNRPPEPVGGLRVSFLTAGDCELEFLENFDPRDRAEIHHGTAGTTKQDQGAITRFIEKHGAGLHHIALKTPNIDATLAHLAANGLRLIDQVGRPGSRRARIGFVHPASFGGVLLHFVEREESKYSST